MNKLVVAFLLGMMVGPAFGQQADSVRQPAPAAKKWFETFSIRGYVQVRYNRLLETNPDLGCEQCDRSWGSNGGISLRRVRIIFSGQLHERVYFYIQPDFASTANGSTTQHFGQLRDAYFDLGLDKTSQFRLRLGQSKIPFGFENMQSSQNRLPLDRADALNSAFSNERDLGAFFYWAPTKVRALFKRLVDDGLKGSGDYGALGLGVFNGQTANRLEQGSQQHVVARFTYPLQIGQQLIEPGLQGYAGQYVLATDQLSRGVKTSADQRYADERIAATFVLYPQPFGIQAEYNTGRGPEFNPATNAIENQRLHGGYVLLNYHLRLQKQELYPFLRAHYYEGGKKHERDARSYSVREAELGIEWEPLPNFELVTMYTLSSRRYEDFQNPDNKQRGGLLRLQAQLNF